MNLLTKIIKKTLEKVKKPGEYFDLTDRAEWCLICLEKYSKPTNDVPNQVLATIQLYDGIIFIGNPRAGNPQFHLDNPDSLDEFAKSLRVIIDEYTPGAEPQLGVKYVQIPVCVKPRKVKRIPGIGMNW